MVAYRQGISRQQHVLYQHYLDEVVGKESLVRVMDAYIESMDVHQLGFLINENTTGAPAYRPQLKLKIYVYGYLNSIRSSRRLERECKRNLELIWLTEGLAPNFKTIANFRKISSSALKEMFRGFLQMCRRYPTVEDNSLKSQNAIHVVLWLSRSDSFDAVVLCTEYR